MGTYVRMEPPLQLVLQSGSSATITHATSPVMSLTQSGNGGGLTIDNDGTGDGIYINQDGVPATGALNIDMASTGRAIRIISNAAGGGELILVQDQNAGSSKAVCYISNAGTGPVLQLVSTTSGLLLPNLTSAQKNAITPADGTIVYDTDLDKLCVRCAGGWQTVTSA